MGEDEETEPGQHGHDGNESELSVETPYSWAVMVATFIGQVMIYGISWTVGVYFVIFLDVFQQGKGATSWVGSINTACTYLAGPISSVLMKKTGVRWMMVIGAVIAAGGLLASSFVTELYHLYLTFGVITGFGLGLAYVPCISAVGFYFDTHRTIAIGISASGVGIGTFVYPPLIRLLEDSFGWRGSLLVLSGVTLNLAVVGAFIRPIQIKQTDKNKNEVDEEKIGILEMLDITIFKNSRYLLLCLNNLLLMFGIGIVYVHLSAYAELQGVKGTASAMLFSAIGIANFLGRIFFGFAGHHPKVNVVLAYILAACIYGVSVECLPVITEYPAMVAIAVIFGFFTGSFGTYLPDILITFLCLHRMPCGYGYLLIFEGIGQLLGAPVAGILYDSTGTYIYSFYLGGTCILVSALILFPAWRWIKPKYLSDVDNLSRSPSLSDEEFGSQVAAIGEMDDLQNGGSLPKINLSAGSIHSHSKSQRSLNQSQYSLHRFGVINRETLLKRRTSSAQCLCQHPVLEGAGGSNRGILRGMI
ncbi:monocarboxylate transporter 13-like isoform X2 [Lineus longissimus]|uniref:monocarboxylate transporter 13-like isoform X2 n=1 Tax=Lineus longissimus TaxID=88925 RepID=UPI002B4EAB6B